MRKFKHEQTKNTADELGDTFYTVKKDKTIICFIPDNMVENTQDWIEIKEPVFTTVDGIEVFEGDEYYSIATNSEIYKQTVSKTDWDFISNTFSTYKSAQEYLDNNAPKYSLSEIIEGCKGGIFITGQLYTELVQSLKESNEQCSRMQLEKLMPPKWIDINQMNLSHLKEGDGVLTLDEKGNIISYKYFLNGLNMIGNHSDNNRKITHWFPLPTL